MSGDRLSRVGLDNLLDLDRFTAEIGGGFWVSMRASVINPDHGRPHGIRYALSLHDPAGQRVLGYDNAHIPEVGTGPARKSKRRKLRFDHRHWRGTITAYDFRSPAQLLMDFWAHVERFMKEEGIE